MPRIDQWRPWLEHKATAALGLPVSIGALEARRHGGLLPALVLRDVVVQEAGAARQPGLRQDTGLPGIAAAPGEALRIARIDLTLSVRRLLLHRGIERLVVEGPELTVRRTADGRILLLGHDLRQPREHQDNAGRDWLFGQPELSLHGGTLHWVDALRPSADETGAPLTLSALELQLRNRGGHHDLDGAATPPTDWGDRLRASGRFVSGADAQGAGDWHAWDGRLQLSAPRIDLAPLRRHLAPAAVGGLDVARGRGALQLQADLRHGALASGAADIAVDDLDARLADGLERLALPRLRARLTGSHADDGSFSLTTQGLDFALGSSRMPRQWPGGNIDLHQTAAAPGATESGRLRADRIDLGMLASLGRSLPLDPAVRRQLQAHAPRGLVETLTAHWRGPVSSPSTYQVAGRATGLAVASVPLTGADAFMVTSTGRKRPRAGTPGIEGASLSFDFDQSQGTARLEIEQGALDFPGVFEEPRLPMHRLSAEARWRVAGRHIEVDVPALRFANADTQGRASLRWQTADAQEGRPDVEGEAHPGRFPGVLDLRGSLGETAGDRVWRYLPTAIPDSARHYVRDAVLAGRATGVEFRVNGDLHHMPFAHPGEGEFRIAAQLKDVTFDFAPQAVLRRAAAEHPERRGLRRDGTRAPAGAGDESPHPWPVLVGLSGALIFEGGTMEVRDARGALAARRLGADEASGDEDAEPLPVDRASARIPDLQHPVVQVRAAAHGDADRMLSIVRGSPLARMVGGSLDRASARGPATLDLALGLPIGRLHETTVQGRVALDRADLRITPDTPLLADTRGAIDFTATGFTATGIRTRMLGGESRVDGRMTGGGTALPLVGFTARGQITAEGVQAERELGFVSRLAARAAGGTDYEAGLTVRYGQPELRIVSSLRGLALDLPAPMGKAAGDKLPLYYRSALVDASLPSSAAVAAHAAQERQPHAGDSGGGIRYPGLRDRLQVQLGDIAAIDYERDLSGPQATVLRGTIGVGLDKGDVLPLPEDGVMAQVNFADVDLDAWERVLADATAGPVRVTAPRRAPPVSPGPGPEAASAGAPGLSASQTYLPDAIAVRADSLTLYGRTVHGVVVGGSREGATWRANLLARELNGYLEYRQPAGAGDAGRVFARLARLDLPQATAREVGSLLEKQPMAARSMPTLDIAIDDFAFNGIPIGQVALAGGPPGAQEASGTATAANAANASGTEVASLWNTGPDDRLLDEENFPQMAEAGAADDTVLPPPAPGDVLWRLRQLRVRMPEALLLAAGDWHQAGGDADGPRRQQASVQVRLDLQDGGRTLQRLGLGDRLLDGGTGRLQGRLAWDDGLLSPDRASLRGRLRVDARDGDLKTVPVGAAKWIGLVNLRSLPRRLRGDFRDLASEGFFFDTLRGDVAVDRGVARTDSLQMQGVIARVEAAGSTDLVRATQDLEVRIRPEADAGLLSILATAVDPAWGLGTLAAQLVLREPLSRMLGRRMRITGTWSAPKVETLARREQDDVPSPADPAGIVAAAAPLPSASGAHP